MIAADEIDFTLAKYYNIHFRNKVWFKGSIQLHKLPLTDFTHSKVFYLEVILYTLQLDQAKSLSKGGCNTKTI